MEETGVIKKRNDKKQKLLLALSGVFIGFINGLFGGGGGMLLVPAYQYIGKMNEKPSHATAIGVILPLSLVSAAVYTLRGVYDVSSGLIIGGGVIAGGVVGALLLKKLSGKLVSAIFYALMIAAGIRMLF